MVYVFYLRLWKAFLSLVAAILAHLYTRYSISFAGHSFDFRAIENSPNVRHQGTGISKTLNVFEVAMFETQV